jgi:hypothetical protein
MRRRFKICALRQILFRLIKSRKMKWAGHAARMEEMTKAYTILVGKSEGKKHFGDLDADGSIILKWVLRE